MRAALQFNKYPGERTFTAIGLGSDNFPAAMLQVVESVVGPVAPEQLSQRPSSGGAYLSVRIGPVQVASPEQVGQGWLAGA
ncbi:uncharacterized protein HaLaN_00033 [Haematococcus lacustris]|uniref:Uncharacterized protein n=1 Tax=Haematococcus lacustris TaxID=44745 RepID=A0A699Y695_HAELA|nr:uncharacterized protein HaLaN_00033 [Haematococcus lacustris]